MLDKDRVMKDFNLTEEEYDNTEALIDWPSYYEQFRKASYIRRVAYKAKLEGIKPEAYLVHKKAKAALLDE